MFDNLRMGIDELFDARSEVVEMVSGLVDGVCESMVQLQLGIWGLPRLIRGVWVYGCS